MTRVFSMGWTWILKFAVINFRDHLLPRNASLIFSTSFIRSDLNHFDHLFLFLAKTKRGNPPPIIQRCVLSGTEGFFSIGESISYLHFMFGEVEVPEILVMHSWRWDESFQISASIRTCPFLLNLWGRGEGEVGFFWGSGYFNKSDIFFPVWSFDRVPKFYQLTMQCVNSLLN